jgi:hypothetical protein
MAKLYLLTPEQIKNGQRPKTPRDKQRDWRMTCIILTSLIILEHIALFVWIH